MAARDFVVAAKVTASSGTLALKTLVLLERERESSCMCVCEREREFVCVSERERERVRVCVRERERESVCVCVCVREREREWEVFSKNRVILFKFLRFFCVKTHRCSICIHFKQIGQMLQKLFGRNLRK
jgi:hypothetical protein